MDVCFYCRPRPLLRRVLPCWVSPWSPSRCRRCTSCPFRSQWTRRGASTTPTRSTTCRPALEPALVLLLQQLEEEDGIPLLQAQHRCKQQHYSSSSNRAWLVKLSTSNTSSSSRC